MDEADSIAMFFHCIRHLPCNSLLQARVDNDHKLAGDLALFCRCNDLRQRIEALEFFRFDLDVVLDAKVEQLLELFAARTQQRTSKAQVSEDCSIT